MGCSGSDQFGLMRSEKIDLEESDDVRGGGASL